MTKKETLKWIVQIIASIASAILTALGATSCMGVQAKKAATTAAFFCVFSYLRCAQKWPVASVK